MAKAALMKKARNQRMYHEIHSLNAGPGGLHCTCCRPGYHSNIAKAKRFVHRVLRRVMKIRLRRELPNLLEE